jgi:hypothetical protein
MHSRTHNEYLVGPQTAVPSDLQQSSIDSRTLVVRESRQRCREYWPSRQTAVSSSQMKPAVDLRVLGNGESRRRHKDSVYRERSFRIDEHRKQAEASSAVDEEQGMRDMPAIRQAVHSGRHKRAFRGHQTDVASFQVQPSIRSSTPGDGVMRRHHEDGVYDRRSNTNDGSREKLTNLSVCRQEWSTDMYSQVRKPKAPDKRVRRIEDRPSLVTEETRGDHNGNEVRKRSYTNIELPVSNDENSHLSEKIVKGQWMACITPSLTNKKGDTPVTQRPTCSRTCNGYLYDPQTAIPSSQPQSSRGSSNSMYGGLRGCPGDARYGGQ